jgi:signal transduction histidine kinase
VLDRGQAVESGDGRRWLDGAIFDVTVRRNAEEAMWEREIVKAQLAEVRASRARVVEAADRARREIERTQVARTRGATAYFTVAEALTNVAKYAHATQAWVAVEEFEDCLRIEVGCRLTDA